MAISIRSILNLVKRPGTAVALLSLLILVTVGVRARVSLNLPSVSTNPQQLLPVQPGPAEMIHFTVYDAGIFPKEVRVSAGSVVLRIEDMSGSSAGLVVVSESLQTVAQVVRRPQHWRDKARVSLGPGRYTVYDASQPTNRATLIVEQ